MRIPDEDLLPDHVLDIRCLLKQRYGCMKPSELHVRDVHKLRTSDGRCLDLPPVLSSDIASPSFCMLGRIGRQNHHWGDQHSVRHRERGDPLMITVGRASKSRGATDCPRGDDMNKDVECTAWQAAPQQPLAGTRSQF